MGVRRTIPVKLDVDSTDAALIRETIQQFLDAANYVVDVAQKGEWVETRKSTLHEETYPVVRDRTDLHSNHVHATLATVDGRVTVEYVFPDENRDTPHSQYLLGGDYETTGATLHEREGEFYLHIRTKADVDAPDRPENGTVLGVDLGVENVAVTSTGTFWSADELNHWHREYEKRRGSLGQCGSRSDGRRLDGSSRRSTVSPTRWSLKPSRRVVRTSPSSD